MDISKIINSLTLVIIAGCLVYAVATGTISNMVIEYSGFKMFMNEAEEGKAAFYVQTGKVELLKDFFASYDGELPYVKEVDLPGPFPAACPQPKVFTAFSGLMGVGEDAHMNVYGEVTRSDEGGEWDTLKLSFGTKPLRIEEIATFEGVRLDWLASGVCAEEQQ